MRKVALVLFIAALAVFSACSPKKNAPEDDGRLSVAVTFHAMKEFVQAVGKEKVRVFSIVPDGVLAHGFEPKARDLEQLSSADVFVYSGLGMEPWAQEAASASGNERLLVVDASKGADLIPLQAGKEHDEHEDEQEKGAHARGAYDPHLWLGLSGAQNQAKTIKEALVQADPQNAEYYEANYTEFFEQAQSLRSEYEEKFQAVEKKTFVTGHAAFGYLCRDFSLQQNSVRDIFAEGEPSAQQLAALVKYCRENQVTTIFSEEMASPAVSNTLANEVGVKVETIYTMETAENGASYLERMRENLEKIYESLQ